MELDPGGKMLDESGVLRRSGWELYHLQASHPTSWSPVPSSSPSSSSPLLSTKSLIHSCLQESQLTEFLEIMVTINTIQMPARTPWPLWDGDKMVLSPSFSALRNFETGGTINIVGSGVFSSMCVSLDTSYPLPQFLLNLRATKSTHDLSGLYCGGWRMGDGYAGGLTCHNTGHFR